MLRGKRSSSVNATHPGLPAKVYLTPRSQDCRVPYHAGTGRAEATPARAGFHRGAARPPRIYRAFQATSGRPPKLFWVKIAAAGRKAMAE
jgi:hypothetical protein